MTQRRQTASEPVLADRAGDHSRPKRRFYCYLELLKYWRNTPMYNRFARRYGHELRRHPGPSMGKIIFEHMLRARCGGKTKSERLA